MKRFACLLGVLLLFPALALAATADAIVVAPYTAKLTAPFSGTLLPFDAQQGDAVSAGDVLFVLDTVPVYAAQGGTVSDVFAAAGDDAAGISARYGGLAALEPDNALYIDASNKDAHDDAQSKWLHAGETLYLKRNNDRGTGRVTTVDGDDYIVEILSGPFKTGDTVRCYRESSYATDSETGRGKVRRYPDIRIPGEGRVAAVHVSKGDRVAPGDLLFELVAPTPPRMPARRWSPPRTARSPCSLSAPARRSPAGSCSPRSPTSAGWSSPAISTSWISPRSTSATRSPSRWTPMRAAPSPARS